MALTDEQAKVLADLQAQRDAPEPRTETGLAGLLHTLIDVVAGRVPHVAPEVWDALHTEAEAQAVPEAEPAEAAEPVSETEPAG